MPSRCAELVCGTICGPRSLAERAETGPRSAALSRGIRNSAWRRETAVAED